jgi:hypothetical protein
MTQPIQTCRRVQEQVILRSIKSQTAEGALYSLIFNALKQPHQHQRAAIINLIKQQGFTAERATTALNVMEMADWIKHTADGLEVLVYLTEYAKLTGGAE